MGGTPRVHPMRQPPPSSIPSPLTSLAHPMPGSSAPDPLQYPGISTHLGKHPKVSHSQNMVHGTPSLHTLHTGGENKAPRALELSKSCENQVHGLCSHGLLHRSCS